MEMTDIQQKAEKIYLASATFESSFKPMTLSALSKELGEGSTSTLGRWKIKFDWDKKLAAIVTAGSIKDGDAKDIIDATSLKENTQKILEDFEANEKLKSDAYAILQQQTAHYVNQMIDGKALSLENTRIVLKILEITTNREDKLLDRQALLSATRLIKSGDTLKALRETTIDVEIED